MLMFFQRPYVAQFLFSSITVASEYLCHISRLPCAWWRNPECFSVHTVCSASSDAHGSSCPNEVHRLLEEVKMIQLELMEAIGFHTVTPSFNTRSCRWKYSICGTAHGGTSHGGTIMYNPSQGDCWWVQTPVSYLCCSSIGRCWSCCSLAVPCCCSKVREENHSGPVHKTRSSSCDLIR